MSTDDTDTATLDADAASTDADAVKSDADVGLDADVRATFTAPGAEPFEVEMHVTVPPGETLVVLGPSGSGKTLLLESIAGFYDHDGRVRLHGRDLTMTAPEQRGFGFVFQDYALFPHMTVRENVRFGARYHDETRDPNALLAELGVAELADRTPKTLSGGEQQRVALARALSIRPDTLLLDEPLAALDVPTRQTLRDELADVLSNVTSVYVTHNRTTARALADRIVVVNDGRVIQRGTPEEVFDRPATAFVAEFVGANVISGDAIEYEGSTNAAVAVRPEHIRFDADGGLTGNAVRVVREDAVFRALIRLDNGEELTAFPEDPPEEGDRLRFEIPAERIVPLGT